MPDDFVRIWARDVNVLANQFGTDGNVTEGLFVHRKWGNDIWTLHVDLNEAKERFETIMDTIIEDALDAHKYSGDFMVKFCFTDRANFRHAILPTYKANRAGKRKPVGYSALVSWVKAEYDTITKANLEADDCIGILATLNPDSSVIISGDKDFKSIPGRFYNFLNDTYYTISEQEADYNHLYQTLIGDAADNYKGCPGIGAVTAKKILDASPTWEACLAQFVKQNLTEEEALTQARVARILRKQDYDFTYKCPILWTPK